MVSWIHERQHCSQIRLRLTFQEHFTEQAEPAYHMATLFVWYKQISKLEGKCKENCMTYIPLISDICLDDICDICLNENYFLFLWLPFTSVVREILRKLNFTAYYYDCILLLAIYLISSLHLSTFIVQCWFFTSWNNHPGCGLVRTISHHLTHLPPLFYFHLFYPPHPAIHSIIHPEYCTPDPATDVNWKLSERPDMIEFAEYTSGRAQHRLTIDKIDWPPNFSCTSVHKLHHILNATESPCWHYKVA